MSVTNTVVGVIMGSDSDLPVMNEAVKVLVEFEVRHEVRIISAHRTPDRMCAYAREARQRGLRVIIAGAGGAAHLPGMTASHTTIPVIGVPVMCKSLSGVDSLYSIVQMPAGIPVATMAINGAKNAGLLAVSILGITDLNLAQRLEGYRGRLEHEVQGKDRQLCSLGAENYLKTVLKT